MMIQAFANWNGLTARFYTVKNGILYKVKDSNGVQLSNSNRSKNPIISPHYC